MAKSDLTIERFFKDMVLVVLLFCAGLGVGIYWNNKWTEDNALQLAYARKEMTSAKDTIKECSSELIWQQQQVANLTYDHNMNGDQVICFPAIGCHLIPKNSKMPKNMPGVICPPHAKCKAEYK